MISDPGYESQQIRAILPMPQRAKWRYRQEARRIILRGDREFAPMKGKPAMDHTLRVDRPSEQVIPELVNALQRRGLRVMITFDLQLARANQVDCQCPHHGTERCTCQYAVLLAYARRGKSEVYRTITIHGRDQQVWLSLLKSPKLPNRAYTAYEALGSELLDILLGLANQSSKELRRIFKMAKDPVCGMEVDPAKAAGTVEYQGETYYFCSPGCKAAFEKEPEKYLGKAEAGHQGHQGHGHH